MMPKGQHHTPETRARMSRTRQAIFADPVRGQPARAALEHGRTDPTVRGKAKKTMQEKAAAPGYSEFMGEISRVGWGTPGSPTRRRRGKKISRGLLASPSFCQDKSQEMKDRWANLKALAEAGKAAGSAPANGARVSKPGPKPGPRASIYKEAGRLHSGGFGSWAQITRRLLPEAYEKDPDGTTERLSKGAKYYLRKGGRTA